MHSRFTLRSPQFIAVSVLVLALLAGFVVHAAPARAASCTSTYDQTIATNDSYSGLYHLQAQLIGQYDSATDAFCGKLRARAIVWLSQYNSATGTLVATLTSYASSYYTTPATAGGSYSTSTGSYRVSCDSASASYSNSGISTPNHTIYANIGYTCG